MGDQAYVPGVDYDIFISYAHVINRPQFGQQFGGRWVNDLAEDLENELAQTLAPIPKIWLSESEKTRKRRGDWWLDVHSALKSSAILITINGPGWDVSGNCQSEKDVFEEEEEDPRTESGARRIIEVVHRLDGGRLPSNLITGDPVWLCPKPQDDPQGRTFDRSTPEYRSGVIEMCRRVERVLREMRATAPAVSLNPFVSSFVFWPPESAISELHKKLKTELSRRYRLVDSRAHAPSLSIHVLGKSNQPEAINEFERVKNGNAANRCMIILDPELSADDADARDYQALEGKRPNLEVYLGVNRASDEIVSQVKGRIDQLFPKPSRQTKVYVICSSSSDRNTDGFKRLEEKLKDYDPDKGPGNKLVFHEGSRKPTQQGFFSRCDGCFLVWQGGNANWFSPQYKEELKTGQKVRPPTNPIAANGVCLMPPEPTRDLERKEEVFSELAAQWTPDNYYPINGLAMDEKALLALVDAFLLPLRQRRAQP
jgi:hypothetical protein